jgi:hypothetical protein
MTAMVTDPPVSCLPAAPGADAAVGTTILDLVVPVHNEAADLVAPCGAGPPTLPSAAG